MSSTHRTTRERSALVGLVLLVLGTVGGCATPGFQRVEPEPLEQVRSQVPEEQLLDVGLIVATAKELDEGQLKKQGTTPDVRQSECTFIPYHLKTTLQRSGYWGSVQVMPPPGDNVDLLVTSELHKSNGEQMQLKVQAVDASGRVWMTKGYDAKVDSDAYLATVRGEHDPFQDLYNTVANDLSEFLRGLSPVETAEIRRVSRLKFAGRFAEDAFGDYLRESDGRVMVQQLPADDDTMMQRIATIRERDYMFVDTLNQYYEGFYNNMWDAYENWRRYNLTEQVALRQVKADAINRTLLGILMIAAAIALEVGDVDNTNTVRDILVLTGGQVVIGGLNVSQQAQIHAAAIEELAESFGAEMRPTVIELEGKTYELTGTATEQYKSWKKLLREIYYEETGFARSDGAEGEDPSTSHTSP